MLIPSGTVIDFAFQYGMDEIQIDNIFAALQVEPCVTDILVLLVYPGTVVRQCRQLGGVHEFVHVLLLTISVDAAELHLLRLRQDVPVLGWMVAAGNFLGWSSTDDM